MKTTLLAMTLTTALLIGGSAFVQGAETQSQTPQKKSMVQPTKEQREQMASLHDKMAECLRSDKTMAECHKEMRQNCESMMGKQGCPMWGGMAWSGGHGRHSHMGHGGMGGTTGSSASDTSGSSSK